MCFSLLVVLDLLGPEFPDPGPSLDKEEDDWDHQDRGRGRDGRHHQDQQVKVGGKAAGEDPAHIALEGDKKRRKKISEGISYFPVKGEREGVTPPIFPIYK